MSAKIKKVALAVLSLALFVCFIMTVIPFLNRTTVHAETDVFAMENGASVKLNSDGLRFRVKMTEDVKEFIVDNDSSERYELHFLIAPESYFDAVGNDYYSLTNGKCIHLTFSDETMIYYQEEDGYYYANGCVFNVKPANRELNFCGIAFIWDNDDEEVERFADFNLSASSRNIYDVMNYAALNNIDVYMDSISTTYSWYGTEDYPIVINSSEQYDRLIKSVNDGRTYTGKYIAVHNGVEPSIELDGGKSIGADEVATLYTVSFNANNSTDSNVVYVKSGEKVSEPVDPERSLYTFSGWYLGENLYDFDSAVTGDITLNARWEIEGGDLLPGAMLYYYKQKGEDHESHNGVMEYSGTYQGKTVIAKSSVTEIETTGGSLSAYWQFNYSTIQSWIDSGYNGIQLKVYIAGPESETIDVNCFSGLKNLVMNVNAWNTIEVSIDDLIKSTTYMFNIQPYDYTSVTFAVAEVIPLEGVLVTFVTEDGKAIESQHILAGETAVCPVGGLEAGYDYLWKKNGEEFSFHTPLTEDTVLYGKKAIKKVSVSGLYYEYVTDGSGRSGYGTLSYDVTVGGKTAIVYAQKDTESLKSLFSCYFSYNVTPEDVQAWIDMGYKQISTNVYFTSENLGSLSVSQFNRSNASSPKTYYTDKWYPVYIDLADFKTVMENASNGGSFSLFALEKPNADGEYGVALTEFTLLDQIYVALTPDSRFNNVLFDYNTTVTGKDSVSKNAYAYASTTQSSYAGYVTSSMHFDINDDEIQELIDEGYSYLLVDIFTSHEGIALFYSDGAKQEIYGNDVIYGERWNRNIFKLSLAKLKGYESGRIIDIKYSVPGTYNLGISEVIAVKEYSVTFKDDDKSLIEVKNVVEGVAVTVPSSLPARTGLSISYWTLDGEKYDLSTPVTGDITLVAVWGPKSITPTGGAYTITTNQSVGGKTAAYKFSKAFSKGQAVDGSCSSYGITVAEVNQLLSDGYAAIKTSIYLTGPDDMVKIRWMLDGNLSGQKYPVNTWIPIVLDLETFKTKVLSNAQNDTFFFQIREVATAGTFTISFLDFEICKLNEVAAEGLSIIRDTDKIKYNTTYQTAAFNQEYQGKDCQVVYSYTGDDGKALYIPIFLATDKSFATTLQTAGYDYIEIEYYLETNNCNTPNSRIIADADNSLTLVAGSWTKLNIPIDKFVDYYVENYTILVHSYKIGAPGTFAISSVRAVDADSTAEYTVTFKNSDGSTIDTQAVTEGESAVMPASLPTRTGYSIKSWTLNGNAYDLSSPVTKNMTLVAVWGPKPITPVGGDYTITTNQSVGGKTAAYKFSKYLSGAVDGSCSSYGISVADVNQLISDGYNAIRTSIYLTGADSNVKIRWMLDGSFSGQRYPVNTWIPIVLDLAAFKTNVLSKSQGDTFFFQIREMTNAGTYTLSFLDFEICKLSDVAENLSVMRDTQKIVYNGVAQTAEFNQSYQGRDCQVVYTYGDDNNKLLQIPMFLATDKSFATTLKNAGYNFIEIEYYLETSKCDSGTALLRGDAANSLTLAANAWTKLYIPIDKFVDNYVADWIIQVHSWKVNAGIFAVSSVRAIQRPILPDSSFVGTSASSIAFDETVGEKTVCVYGTATVTKGGTAVANYYLDLTAAEISAKLAAGYTNLAIELYIDCAEDVLQMDMLNDAGTISYYYANSWITVNVDLAKLADTLNSGYLFRLYAADGGTYGLAIAGYEFATDNVVSNNFSQYKICISANATSAEKDAAGDVQAYIYESTGVRLPIVRVYSHDNNVKYISLGDTEITKKYSLIGDYETLGDSGYSIKTIDGNIIIYAATEKGVINGAYGYLADAINYDFFGAGVSAFDAKENIAVNVYSENVVPDVNYSVSSFGYVRGYTQSDISNKERLNVYAFEDVFAGSCYHNSLVLLPYATYGTRNANWYSSSHTQICYSAHGNSSSYNGLKNEVATILYNLLMENPSKLVVAFNMMDTDEGDICTCWKCTANKNSYGSWSANIVLFLNDVAPIVQSKLTAAGDSRADTFKISFMAYHDYCAAPNNVSAMIFNKHVVPMVCDSRIDLLKGINDDSNGTYRSNIQAWRAIAWEVYFWGYDVQFLDGGCMIPYFSEDNYDDLYAYGKVNAFSLVVLENQAFNEYATGFGSLKAYLQAKLAWDKDADVDELTDKFFNAMYGSQATAMKTIYNEMKTFMANLETNGVVGGRVTTKTGFFANSSNWPKATLQDWYDRLDAIETALTEAGDMQGAKNVRLEKLFPLYVLIRVHTVDSSLIDEMADLLDEFSISYISQGQTAAAYKTNVLGK